MNLNHPRSDPIALTERGLALIQEEATQTARRWIITAAVLALLPIPVAVLAGQHLQAGTYRVPCSETHPCPISITSLEPFHRPLPMWEVVTHEP